MEKAQYAIMRFAKYKGPEIGNIEDLYCHLKRIVAERLPNR